MDPVLLKRLQGISNEAAIEQALREFCEPYGGIKKFHMTIDEQGSRMCFVELEHQENQTRLYSVLNGMSFGNSFVFRIP